MGKAVSVNRINWPQRFSQRRAFVKRTSGLCFIKLNQVFNAEDFQCQISNSKHDPVGVGEVLEVFEP